MRALLKFSMLSLDHESMHKFRKYTKPQLVEAVKTSTSVRKVLSCLGLKEAGGNYSTIKELIVEYQLDTSHFHGVSWKKGKTLGPKRTLDDYLTNRLPIQSHKLKVRLLAEGMFEHKCQLCGLHTWLGKVIPLELHHIDGNNKNNNLKNIQLLCPNCHATTPNYRGKAKQSSK